MIKIGSLIRAMSTNHSARGERILLLQKVDLLFRLVVKIFHSILEITLAQNTIDTKKLVK